MAYTLKNPSTNLRILVRTQPEVSQKSENQNSKPVEYGIRIDHWYEMRKVMLEALLPHTEARLAVVAAIQELERRLGVDL